MHAPLERARCAMGCSRTRILGGGVNVVSHGGPGSTPAMDPRAPSVHLDSTMRSLG